MIPEGPTCVCCGEQPAASRWGYCGTCHWVIQAELMDGFERLDAYLASWARFGAWCETHQQVAA